MLPIISSLSVLGSDQSSAFSERSSKCQKAWTASRCGCFGNFVSSLNEAREGMPNSKGCSKDQKREKCFTLSGYRENSAPTRHFKKSQISKSS